MSVEIVLNVEYSRMHFPSLSSGCEFAQFLFATWFTEKGRANESCEKGPAFVDISMIWSHGYSMMCLSISKPQPTFQSAFSKQCSTFVAQIENSP